jgi:RNA chaperone Hfq
VAVYLSSGLKRVGTLQQFDPFTLWLQVPDGRDALVFRHLISRIVPASR